MAGSPAVTGGPPWGGHSRVPDFPPNPTLAFPGGRFIGDYFGIAATDDDVYMVWADGRLGEFGPANQKIGFARQQGMPAPSIFITPPSGPAGQDIVIQGHNFQPNRNVFIEVAGVIVSTARTQDTGRFTTQIFMPISGEGAHVVRVIEESGNQASTSFFMDFGFDTIQDTTDALSDLIQRMDSGEPGPDGFQVGPNGSVSQQLEELRLAIEALSDNNGGTSSRLLIFLLLAALVPVLAGGGVLLYVLRRRA